MKVVTAPVGLALNQLRADVEAHPPKDWQPLETLFWGALHNLSMLVGISISPGEETKFGPSRIPYPHDKW